MTQQFTGATLLNDPDEIRKLATKVQQANHSRGLMTVLDEFAGLQVEEFSVTNTGGALVFVFRTDPASAPTFLAQDMALTFEHPFVQRALQDLNSAASRLPERPEMYRTPSHWFTAHVLSDSYWYKVLNLMAAVYFRNSPHTVTSGQSVTLSREEYLRPVQIYLVDHLEEPDFGSLLALDMGLSAA